MQPHPWLPTLIATRPLLGPHALVRAEAGLWRGRVRDPSAEADLRAQAQRYLDGLAEDYPTPARHADLTGDDFDGAFELGLATVLDGIEAQLVR